MIINLGCASVDNHIPRDDIFDYHPRRECNIYIVLYRLYYIALYHSETRRHVIASFYYFQNTVIWKISRGFNFRETSRMRSFVKIKPLGIGDITLSFTDIGKSYPVRDFFTSQMCLLTLFSK